MAEDELVNKRLVKWWLSWSLVWLTVFPLVGVLVSIKFHHPEFLGDDPWFTFGRLRPIHVNGVLFGAFTTPILGMLYHVIPHLCGRRMAAESLGWWTLAGWNLFLITGTISFLFGYTLGYEADEFELPFNVLRWIVLAIIGGQVMVTIFRRVERGFYVSLWYTIAALVWVLLLLILGNFVLPYAEITGVNNVNLHALYLHYSVGLWITPIGNAMIYYFVPVTTKNPLFSHRLSIIGFWSIAFLYPFVGTHHYLFSPLPYHTQTISIVTSMLLIIPVWTVVVNWLGTYMGRWREIWRSRSADGYAAKFLLLATIYYVLGCFQGSLQSLRWLQLFTHFNDFVISHSHFTVFGTFIVGAVGGMYYLWPRVTGNELWSPRLASWHLRSTILGSAIMFVGLGIQGVMQSDMLREGENFVDTVVVMKPWWFLRSLAGIIMDIGFALMVINFIQTARHRKPFRETSPEDDDLENHPAAEEAHKWYSQPSAVFIVAGIIFFSLAVLIQGIQPSLMPEMSAPTVKEARTGFEIRVADYTPLEKRGREVYIREGCWYCHSQYTRPVNDENMRWGPVAQAGEYAWDQPHLFSTRRIGPDLARVGRRYDDDWHAAHHWDPRMVVPDSMMPRFPWLYEEPVDGETPRPNEDGKALIAYIQRLGTNIGDWREEFPPTELTRPMVEVSSDRSTEDRIAFGEQVYQRRCVTCHGENGDGEGPAAGFLEPKPRDFTSGIFKFRSTAGGPDTLPTDEDLYITISHGLWGTAMPPWYKIRPEERRAVIQYIKTFSERWENETVPESITIPEEPPVSDLSLRRGKEMYERVCALCHGESGSGDGPSAGTLTDTWGNPVRPANFTLPAGEAGGVKLGHDARHIFTVIMTGIGGTPMPDFNETFTATQAWDVVHYVQSLRIEAHIDELLKAGLDPARESEARTKIWSSLSAAAEAGDIDSGLLQAGHDRKPVVLSDANAQTTGGGP